MNAIRRKSALVGKGVGGRKVRMVRGKPRAERTDKVRKGRGKVWMVRGKDGTEGTDGEGEVLAGPTNHRSRFLLEHAAFFRWN